jgi:hypothetical protein
VATQTWRPSALSSTRGLAAPGWTVTSIPFVTSGIGCALNFAAATSGGRQLLDDFAIDTDPSGWAHTAYSHDSPDLGGAASYTGYLIQTSGTQAGYPN